MNTLQGKVRKEVRMQVTYYEYFALQIGEGGAPPHLQLQVGKEPIS